MAPSATCEHAALQRFSGGLVGIAKWEPGELLRLQRAGRDSRYLDELAHLARQRCQHRPHRSAQTRGDVSVPASDRSRGLDGEQRIALGALHHAPDVGVVQASGRAGQLRDRSFGQRPEIDLAAQHSARA
jgi:hypothetical protein